mgnify:CR=1 FL=1
MTKRIKYSIKGEDQIEKSFSKLIHEIEAERTNNGETSPCFIFQLHSFKIEDYDESEILGLVQSAGYKVLHYFHQNGMISSKTFLRMGRVKQIDALLNETLTESQIDELVLYAPKSRKSLIISSLNKNSDFDGALDENYSNNEGEMASNGSTVEINDQVLNEILEGNKHFDDIMNDGSNSEGMDDDQDEQPQEYKPWSDPKAEQTALEKLKKEFKEFYKKIKMLKDNERTNLTAIFNNRLNHMQLINLSQNWKIKVIDRDQLILEIFERNARTKEAFLQIQLAKMNFETAKLKKDIGTMISEKQGKDFAGAGMAAWVPMYRSFREKKGWIEDQLEKIKQNRQIQRKNRIKLFNVAIVGYTNAGKSTFMNWIAKTKQETNDSEFTTSTPKTAAINYPLYDKNGAFLSFEKLTFTDTVGFIYDIPHVLIDSFLSTLEEIKYTDCILLMIDISEPDEIKIKKKIDTCISTIREIGAEDITTIYVFNKVDLVPREKLDEKIKLILSFVPQKPFTVISSKKKQGFNELLLLLSEIRKKLGFKD